MLAHGSKLTSLNSDNNCAHIPFATGQISLFHQRLRQFLEIAALLQNFHYAFVTKHMPQTIRTEQDEVIEFQLRLEKIRLHPVSLPQVAIKLLAFGACIQLLRLHKMSSNKVSC